MSPTHSQVEVELKFEAAPTVVLPDFGQLADVADVDHPDEEELSATYFDTPDLRLLQNGVTLRRRTGGRDAGWHLKLPRAADDERLELSRPLGRAVRTPPKALADLVRVQVRGQALRPAAEVCTRRIVHRLLDSEGRALAEVADDHVTARILDAGEGAEVRLVSWREVEVELVDGGRKLLAAAAAQLGDAGADASSTGSKLRRLLGDRLPVRAEPEELTKKSRAGDVALSHLREQAAALMAWDPYARLDEPDAVHKMRVSSRRLRSALVTFRPLLNPAHTETLRADLKWLGAVLGAARDAEVIHERLVRLVGDESPELLPGPVRQRIDRELRTRHRHALAAMRAELNGERYFHLLDSLDALTEHGLASKGPAARKASAALPRLVARARQRVLRAAKKAKQAESDEQRDYQRHEVRKAAKRARYAAESVAPVFGRPALTLATKMEDLQEVLGEQQDSAASRDVLRQLGIQAHMAGESGFAFGRLHGLEQDFGDQRYQEVLKDIKARKPGWLR